MESQPQNPEFRNNPENFHPWTPLYPRFENGLDQDQLASNVRSQLTRMHTGLQQHDESIIEL